MNKGTLFSVNKVWYAAYKGKAEGPYSSAELKRDPRFTPDTFVWKEGFETWKKARDVAELKSLFKDEDEEEPQEPSEEKKPPLAPHNELVMEMGKPPHFIWIFIAIIIIAYLIGQLFWR